MDNPVPYVDVRPGFRFFFSIMESFMKQTKEIFLLICLSSLLISATPIVTHPEDKSSSEIKGDVAYCRDHAEKTYKSQAESNTGKKAARGAARGAIVGGAASSLFGNSSKRNRRNAAIGAGVGAASGAASAKRNEEQIIRNIESQCLVEKGYTIQGWN